MNIIGITHPISWNSAACAISNNELSFFLEEERIIRYKHAPRVFPLQSIQIAKTFLSSEQFDVAVGFAYKSLESVKSALSHDCWDESVGIELAWANGQSQIFHHFKGHRIHFFDHQEAHAFSVIAQNQFSKGLVMSIDGWGGNSSGLIARWNGVELFSLERISRENSLGSFYSKFTVFCGFPYHSGEGVLMGLAALGNAIRELPDELFDLDTFLPINSLVKDYLNQLKLPISIEEKADWALTAQYYFERAILKLVSRHLSQEDTAIMLAGGCALNCRTNGKLTMLYHKHRIVAQPVSTDAGTAFGAAVALALTHGQKIEFKHAYLGCEFKSPTLEISSGMREIPFDINYAVKLLLQGDVLAVCVGRDEVGPRALCNRSLIMGGHIKEARKVLNAVKLRQDWRPVAPVTIPELLAECIDLPINADLGYMNVALPASENLKLHAPSCVHYDGTVRIQVMQESHPLHQLLRNYYLATGCPVLANTSFNIGQEPIVHNFLDALRTFRQTDRIKALVLMDKMIVKSPL